MTKHTFRRFAIMLLGTLTMIGCSEDNDVQEEEQALRTADLSGYTIIVKASIGGNSRVVPETGAWQDGDKLFLALDDDDSNVYQLTYSALGNNFAIDAMSSRAAGFASSGTVAALYASKPTLAFKDGKVQGTTLGDIIYTQSGSYTKADKTITITLALNDRKTSLVKLTGLKGEAYVDNMKSTFTQLTSLKDMTWAADDTTPSYVYDAATGTSYCYGVLPDDRKINVRYVSGGSFEINEPLPELATGEMKTVASPDAAPDNWTSTSTRLSDLTVWINDEAWTKEFDAPGFTITSTTLEPSEGSDWLSASTDGQTVTVTATANTTGAPRQAAITISDGTTSATVNVTQIDVKDLAGTWDMTVFKVFTGSGDASTGTYDSQWSYTATTPPTSTSEMKLYDGQDYGNSAEVNISLSEGVTATACDGLINKSTAASHTNNLLLKGLYENLTSQAWGSIDYDNQTATVGLFFDFRSSASAQRLYTGTFAGQYAAFFPELRHKTTSAWAFNFATIGGSQMFWYMGKLAVNGHTSTLKWEANSTSRQNLSTSTNYDIWGLQVLRYTSKNMSAATLIRQGTTTSTNAAYAKTYQGDMKMTRTAEGYTEITIGGDN